MDWECIHSVCAARKTFLDPPDANPDDPLSVIPPNVNPYMMTRNDSPKPSPPSPSQHRSHLPSSYPHATPVLFPGAVAAQPSPTSVWDSQRAGPVISVNTPHHSTARDLGCSHVRKASTGKLTAGSLTYQPAVIGTPAADASYQRLSLASYSDPRSIISSHKKLRRFCTLSGAKRFHARVLSWPRRSHGFLGKRTPLLNSS